MSSKVISFSYGRSSFSVRVEHRERKTLAITVTPNGNIQVSAPSGTSEKQLCDRLRKRARWIKRQIGYFAQFRPRTPTRQFVSGETHLYLGRQYRLKLLAGSESLVKLRGGYFYVSCKGGDRGIAGELLWRWYRQRAEVKFPERLDHCLKKFGSEEAPPLMIKRLKKRWGSLAPSGLLTLNLDLIRAPTECIDYVIIHELCHLEHPNHGVAFTRLLSSKLRDWQAKKRKLELRLS